MTDPRGADPGRAERFFFKAPSARSSFTAFFAAFLKALAANAAAARAALAACLAALACLRAAFTAALACLAAAVSVASLASAAFKASRVVWATSRADSTCRTSFWVAVIFKVVTRNSETSTEVCVTFPKVHRRSQRRGRREYRSRKTSRSRSPVSRPSARNCSECEVAVKNSRLTGHSTTASGTPTRAGPGYVQPRRLHASTAASKRGAEAGARDGSSPESR